MMSETWIEEKGWERIRERILKGIRWEAQMANRKNMKGRAIGEMVIRVRNGIEMIKKAEKIAVEGIMKKLIKIGEDKWRIAGVYVNGDVRKKWEGMSGR